MTEAWIRLLPILVLAGGALFAMGASAVRRGSGGASALALWTPVAGLLALAAAFQAGDGDAAGGFTLDAGARVGAFLALLATWAAASMGPPAGTDPGDEDEHAILVLIAGLGAVASAMAADLLVLFTAIETASLAVYGLLAFRRTDRPGLEAAVKYLILGGVAAGLLLMGIALVLFAHGGATPDVLAEVLAGFHTDLGGLGAVLLLLAAALKLAVAPLHLWSAEVVGGAPPSGGQLVGTATKIGMFIAVGRWLEALPSGVTQTIAFVAAASMVLGALLTLRQRDLGHLLGASAVAQSGFALAAAGEVGGADALLAYLVGYMPALSVVFLALAGTSGGAKTARLDGLAQRDPAHAIALTVGLLGVSGLPFTSGFLGKLSVLDVLIGGHNYGLAGVVVVASVVSAWAYLMPLAAVWRADHVSSPTGFRASAVPALFGAAFVVGVGVWPGPLFAWLGIG
ncbi:MAG: putative NADH-quinone oxidoreductase chain [Pseudomonadota bacterium]|jgi:NADH-quinone oxidoreductase subunit N